MIIEVQNKFSLNTNNNKINELISNFEFSLLTYSKSAKDILNFVNIDSETFIAHIYAAIFYLLTEKQTGRAKAKVLLENIKHVKNDISERELWLYQAVVAWHDLQLSNSAETFAKIIKHYPEDVFSAKLCQYLHYNENNNSAALHVAELIIRNNKDNPYAYGLLASGYERTGQYKKAEDAGRHAISFTRFEPWAQHAVAHALEQQNRGTEALEWMLNYSDTWQHCNKFMYTHNWWHVALYYLNQNNIEQVFKIYHDCIDNEWYDYSKNIAGSFSLLWQYYYDDYEWPGKAKYFPKAITVEVSK